MQIRDPQTQTAMAVKEDGRARGFVTIEHEIAYQSEEKGYAYSWSGSYNAGAADTILWLRNDDTEKHLKIDTILISGTSIRTEFTIHSPVNAVPAGTTVTGVNLNRGAGRVAQATAVRDETNNTQANVLVSGTVSDNTIPIELRGAVILDYLDCIAVDMVTATTIGAVTILGFFHKD